MVHCQMPQNTSYLMSVASVLRVFFPFSGYNFVVQVQRLTEELLITLNQVRQGVTFFWPITSLMPLLKQLQIFGHLQAGFKSRLHNSTTLILVEGSLGCLGLAWFIHSLATASQGVSRRLTRAYAAKRTLLRSPSAAKSSGLMEFKLLRTSSTDRVDDPIVAVAL